jgi:single-stranded-DNA-specific exonuclease
MKFEKWDIGAFDRESAVEFCRNGINPLVSVFLASRGVTDANDAKEAIRATPHTFYDPFLMKDMDKAVGRINRAVEDGEKIAIYGDYDVDGMTASVILALWLRSRGAEYEIYIPGRFDEGYGLNTHALDELKSRGVGLVVTVDCGITAIEEARHAAELGLGLVITDHHECRDVLPEAEAVVDPKRSDCAYPFKSLAGVGVAFKLICALDGDYLSDEIFERYCELVAVGTVADVMPVVGENRNLIRRGLRIMNENPRPGIRRLLKEVDTDASKANATTIGFTIAPRLNAAGRMGQPELSVDILLTDSDEIAETLAVDLCRLNTERRNLELEIYEEAITMLPEDGPDGPIVLASEKWYQGVTGIVAAKMSDRYRLPVIIISIEKNGEGRGSCRSYGSFSIYEALCSCEELLLNYGGHEMAAGVTVAKDNIDTLRNRITDYYNTFIKNTPATGLRVDFEVEKPELLEIQNLKALECLEPFGSGNPPPCLCILEATVISMQSIGAGKHTRLVIEKSGHKLDSIFFSVTVDELGVSKGDLVDVAFEPQINEYRGRSSVQLQLLDIRGHSK